MIDMKIHNERIELFFKDDEDSEYTISILRIQWCRLVNIRKLRAWKLHGKN